MLIKICILTWFHINNNNSFIIIIIIKDSAMICGISCMQNQTHKITSFVQLFYFTTTIVHTACIYANLVKTQTSSHELSFTLVVCFKRTKHGFSLPVMTFLSTLFAHPTHKSVGLQKCWNEWDASYRAKSTDKLVAGFFFFLIVCMAKLLWEKWQLEEGTVNLGIPVASAETNKCGGLWF